MRNPTHGDMPLLRGLRDMYRVMISAANDAKSKETDIGMLLGFAGILDELQGKFDTVGKQLARLERSANISVGV